MYATSQRSHYTQSVPTTTISCQFIVPYTLLLCLKAYVHSAFFHFIVYCNSERNRSLPLLWVRQMIALKESNKVRCQSASDINCSPEAQWGPRIYQLDGDAWLQQKERTCGSFRRRSGGPLTHYGQQASVRVGSSIEWFDSQAMELIAIPEHHRLNLDWYTRFENLFSETIFAISESESLHYLRRLAFTCMRD